MAPLLLSGCNRFKPKVLTHYVYVTAKSTYLRDRIAAVSNRTGNVVNGQRLEILEQNRHFYRVRTDNGEVGWIDERNVLAEKVVDQFDALAKEHANDPAVATGTATDDVYLHVAPGIKTDRFYRLQDGEKLKLLQRASMEKPLPPGQTVESLAKASGEKVDPNGPPPRPPMQDWWLVRDQNNHTGWMVNGLLNTDVPDAIERYAEGQRIVGAYIINKVVDPEIEGPSKEVPQYVTVTSPPREAGLPYDFNQLRVFSWNLKRHRYETANRDKNILGYLPVKLGSDPGTPAHNGIPGTGPAPTYSYTVLAAGAPIPQADANGQFKPAKNQLVTKTYRLEGNITRRVLPPGAQPPVEAELQPVEKKEKAGKKRRR